MTPEREEFIERRIADLDRRQQENRNRISILEDDVRSLTAVASEVRDDVKEVKATLKDLQVDQMNPEERAAFRLLAKKQVFDDETEKLHHREEMDAQRRRTIWFAGIAAASPLLTFILTIVMIKLLGIHG